MLFHCEEYQPARITAVIVERIKEQQAIIAQLQQENVEMKAKVDKMAKILNIE